MNTDETSFSVKTAESADIASQFLKEKGFIIMDRSIDREMMYDTCLHRCMVDLLIQCYSIFFASPSPTLGLD